MLRNFLKAIHMAEANDFGLAFGAHVKKIAMSGQLLTVLLLGIIHPDGRKTWTMSAA